MPFRGVTKRTKNKKRTRHKGVMVRDKIREDVSLKVHPLYWFCGKLRHLESDCDPWPPFVRKALAIKGAGIFEE